MKRSVFYPSFVLCFMASVAHAGYSPRNLELDLLGPPPTSVYEINPTLDGAIIVISSFASLWANANSGDLIDLKCPCDPSDVNSFDRGAVGNMSGFGERASDFTMGAAAVFPAILDYIDVGFSKEFVEDMVVYAESLSLNGVGVTLSNYSTNRPIPRTYAGDSNYIKSDSGYQSFYSGHTSITFVALSTASMTYTLRHPGAWWPWVVTGVVGTSVAFERVAAGRHFKTDVIAGAIAGTAIGIAVPLAHKRLPGDQSVSFLPIDRGSIFYWKMNY